MEAIKHMTQKLYTCPVCGIETKDLSDHVARYTGTLSHEALAAARAEQKGYFEEPSPLGDRDTRGDAISDYAENIEDDLAGLRDAIANGDVEAARKRFKEIKGWVDAIDDNLCERDENGQRVD